MQYNEQMAAPHVIYADFEALMNQNSEEKQIHEISYYSLVAVSSFKKPRFHSHRGVDAGPCLI